MELANLYFMLIAGFSVAAFGVERILNHKLYAGGSFFLVLSLVVIVTAVAQLYSHFKDSEWK